jgi:hypothetical protein
MKWLLTCFALLLFIHSPAQLRPKLYYFIQREDSLVGVKDEHGKIIIPAKYEGYGLWLDNEDIKVPIKDDIIILVGSFPGTKQDRSIPSHAWGDAFDRKGNFLFHPLSYDNAYDAYHEGLTRCVENNKAGFADREGRIIIKPQYDWVSEFYYGYAIAYIGCSVDYEKDPEHPPFAFARDADTFYINRKGEQITPSDKPASRKDQLIFGKYFPYNFAYTEAERRLLDSFDRKDVISKIAFSNYYPLRKGREAQLQFEITERQADRKLIVTAFEWSNGAYSPRDDLSFTADKNGKWYHEDLYQGKESFKAWIKRELKSCKDFFMSHPDAPNRFNPDRY